MKRNSITNPIIQGLSDTPEAETVTKPTSKPKPTPVSKEHLIRNVTVHREWRVKVYKFQLAVVLITTAIVIVLYVFGAIRAGDPARILGRSNHSLCSGRGR